MFHEVCGNNTGGQRGYVREQQSVWVRNVIVFSCLVTDEVDSKTHEIRQEGDTTTEKDIQGLESSGFASVSTSRSLFSEKIEGGEVLGKTL